MERRVPCDLPDILGSLQRRIKVIYYHRDLKTVKYQVGSGGLLVVDEEEGELAQWVLRLGFGDCQDALL